MQGSEKSFLPLEDFFAALMGSTVRTLDGGPSACTQFRGQLAGGSMREEHRVPDDSQAPSGQTTLQLAEDILLKFTLFLPLLLLKKYFENFTDE